MNAVPLFTKDGYATNMSYCSACMMPKPHEAAESCCKKGICETCGSETTAVLVKKCYDCQEKTRMDAAEKIDGWSGPVIYRDRYYETLDSLLDDTDEKNLPEFVWIVETERIPKLDATDILDRLCEDLYEDAYENLNGVDEFEKAVAAFNEANSNNTYWLESMKRAAKVSPREGGG